MGIAPAAKARQGVSTSTAILLGLRLRWEVCISTVLKDAINLKNLKLAQTISYFLSFVALGLAIAALGPTLPGLAEQTHVPLDQISFLFTVRSFGFLLGSLASGRFFDRL